MSDHLVLYRRAPDNSVFWFTGDKRTNSMLLRLTYGTPYKGGPSITMEMKSLEGKVMSLFIKEFRQQVMHALVKDSYL